MIKIKKGMVVIKNGFEMFIWKRNKLYYAYISVYFPNKYTGQEAVEKQSLTKVEFDVLRR